jgi:23S rRNA (uracil1939-C5)-methyltransferase
VEFASQETKICEIIDLCGSCPLLHVPYQQQLETKRKNFKTLIQTKAEAFASVPVSDCIASPQTLGYRYSAKLVVGQKKRKGELWTQIGLYRPGTHDIIDIGKCPVQAQSLNAIAGYLRRVLSESGISIYNEISKTGMLRYLVLRSSFDEKHQFVTFVTANAEKTQLKILARQLMEVFPRVVGCVQHVNTSSGNEIFQNSEDSISGNLQNTWLLAGNSFFVDEIAGLKLRLSCNSFFQINPGIAQRIYSRIYELMPTSPQKSALDLYCGIGGIALSLAPQFGQVVGIEENSSGVLDAIENVGLNGRKNLEVVQGRVEEVLEQVLAQKVRLPLGAVVLNPSRRGAQPKVIEMIGSSGAPLVAYVSCFPETLLRDLLKLKEYGYNPVFFELFDMFPGTSHYEVLAFLEKTTESKF